MQFHYYSTIHRIPFNVPIDNHAIYEKRKAAGLQLGTGISCPECLTGWVQDFTSERELTMEEQAALFVEPVEWLRMRLDREYADKLTGIRR